MDVQPEFSKGLDAAVLGVMIADADKLNWGVKWQVEKFEGDIKEGDTPYEVIEGEGNLLVNAGIALFEDLLIGAGGIAYNNANSYLGVGDSNTAASVGQTDLQAASNKLRKAMDATYPSRASQTVTWKATFATGDANFAWEEWAIFNNSTGGTMLNRKVTSMGTKTSAGSWVLTVTVTIS